MGVKQVERRFCDFCDKEAASAPCCLCHKDFCYAHGDTYRPGDLSLLRRLLALCDVCRGALAKKLSARLEAVE